MSWRTVFWKPLLQIIFITALTSGILKPLPMIENTIDRANQWAIKDAIVEVEQLQIKVMTYNIRHGRGLDGKVNLTRIAEDIRLSRADLVGLQEVDRFNIRSGFKDQAKVLAELTGMNWSFSPSLKLGFTQYGNAILSKYPIVSNEVYSLPGIKEARSLQKAVIRYGQKDVIVYNTHLGVYAAEREQQLPMISDIVLNTEGPAVFLGDFNMESNHSLMEKILGRWQKVKLKVQSATVLSGLEIDHIFVNHRPQVFDAWTMTSDASDHTPVIAELNWGFIGRSLVASSE